MCLFPLPNNDIFGIAYKKGVVEFDCGSCPECLRKRSNVWALRSVYETKAHVYNCMVTLTYDSFKYSDRRSNEELPVDPSIVVDKTHIQKFIKRLRKWISTHPDSGCDSSIKYIACAEYGSHTHRAHYHLILFGVRFNDFHFYKKSKRGNVIYMSDTLTKLWSHGICTIDCLNVGSAVARYCTKYCAKERSDDTFMLCSQFIGVHELLKDFNGLNYFIDGREYPIPRVVWQAYIMNKYRYMKNVMSPKYVNRNKDIEFECDDSEYLKSVYMRKLYRFQRDKDPVYVRYLNYWSSKGSFFDSVKNEPLKRIYLLDDRRYHFYKVKALECYFLRRRGIPAIAPGSGCVSAYFRYKELHRIKGYDALNLSNLYRVNACTCPTPSRPNRASDTDLPPWIIFYEKIHSKLLTKNYFQVNMFDV